MGWVCVADGRSGVGGPEQPSFLRVFPGESGRAAGKGRGSQRARSRRGSRARASKDTSKLLLLYDEDILERDPLREQKDLAFAQAYLTRVGRGCFPLPPVPTNKASSRDQCTESDFSGFTAVLYASAFALSWHCPHICVRETGHRLPSYTACCESLSITPHCSESGEG